MKMLTADDDSVGRNPLRAMLIPYGRCDTAETQVAKVMIVIGARDATSVRTAMHSRCDACLVKSTKRDRLRNEISKPEFFGRAS